jgi:hypothetical protein
MADEQSGMQRDYLKDFAPWTKLFTAFKVALDPKKLLLGGCGLFVMSLGWYILSAIFFAANAKMPEWGKEGYTPADFDGKADVAYAAFKADRHRWNLRYEMAGSPSSPDKAVAIDAGDLAENFAEHEEIEKELADIRDQTSRLSKKLTGEEKGGVLFVGIEDQEKLSLGIIPRADKDALTKALSEKKLDVAVFKISGEGKNLTIRIGDFVVDPVNADAVAPIRTYIDGARTFESIRDEYRKNRRNEKSVNIALMLYEAPHKPWGRLRTLPWFEDRGPNPYLLVTGNARTLGPQGKSEKLVLGESTFFNWLLGDQVPVLLEPLVKFFRPIVYLFDPAAGFWNRVYLFLVILWSMATWALFGGAITRIAAVQVARTNERVGLAEAVKFVVARYRSYLLAPLLPLVFLIFLSAGLWVVGLAEVYTFALGDLLVPLIWPIMLIIGLIMAVVLVGLVGWPLMYSTISAEGSDSFDAISRSYSYVYGAPWQYLWYSFVAVVYGAVLVFFIGLMGSLTVYLSKWAFALPPAPANRETAYLFKDAPTSYGWRDLLLHKSPNARPQKEITNSGKMIEALRFEPSSPSAVPSGSNYVGSFFIAVWLYVLFLLMVGFGYSYFWTSSTIIYLLMRRKVDDTEMDEIHLEEEPEASFSAPVSSVPAAVPASAPPPPQMVETPQLRLPTEPPPPEAPKDPKPM